MNYKHAFIVGIKGVAMANLALILQQKGVQVSGCDVAEEFITDESLQKAGIVVQSMTEAVPQEIDVVIYSAAHGGTQNPLVQEAEKRGVAVKHQEDILAEVMNEHEVRIAVCGSHGKTTTTAMLAYCLEKLGAKPSYMVGTSTFSGMSGGAYGGGKYFVIEADEYAIDPPRDKSPKFLKLNPTHIICTNIDFDHPDVYENLESVRQVFAEFFKKGATLYVSPDPVAQEVAKESVGDMYKTYAAMELTLSVPGEKNNLNASGVVTLLKDLGYENAAEVIKDFVGAKRRFEQIAFENNTYLFDDYAHHPAEIEATISAARMRFPDRRIAVLFQPHTYSRTESLLTEFGQALSQADVAVLAPIFASAREGKHEHPEELLRRVAAAGNGKIQVWDGQNEHLKSFFTAGDVIFTMGAGDIYKAKDGIINAIKSA